MHTLKTGKDIRCPLEYGLDVYGGKWKSRIICVLESKNILHYSEFRSELGNITDAVLAAALRELILEQIVSRQAFNEIPPHVEYSLTEKGRSVVPILQSICKWANIYNENNYTNVMSHCRSCNNR